MSFPVDTDLFPHNFIWYKGKLRTQATILTCRGNLHLAYTPKCLLAFYEQIIFSTVVSVPHNLKALSLNTVTVYDKSLLERLFYDVPIWWDVFPSHLSNILLRVGCTKHTNFELYIPIVQLSYTYTV